MSEIKHITLGKIDLCFQFFPDMWTFGIGLGFSNGLHVYFLCFWFGILLNQSGE